jgi:hypothetical protein
MKTTTQHQAEGERRKADALTLLQAQREVFVRRGRRALLEAMLDGDGTATADDVRDAVKLPDPADDDPGAEKRQGVLFNITQETVTPTGTAASAAL